MSDPIVHEEKSPPLWLPTGSIRAILALTVVIVAMVMFALNRQVPDSLGIIVTAVIVYYFQKPSSGA